MTKKPIVPRRDFDDAFKREALRILASSGRTVEEVAKDLGIGRSSLSKWESQFREAERLAHMTTFTRSWPAFAARMSCSAPNGTC